MPDFRTRRPVDISPLTNMFEGKRQERRVDERLAVEDERLSRLDAENTRLANFEMEAATQQIEEDRRQNEESNRLEAERNATNRINAEAQLGNTRSNQARTNLQNETIANDAVAQDYGFGMARLAGALESGNEEAIIRSVMGMSEKYNGPNGKVDHYDIGNTVEAMEAALANGDFNSLHEIAATEIDALTEYGVYQAMDQGQSEKEKLEILIKQQELMQEELATENDFIDREERQTSREDAIKVKIGDSTAIADIAEKMLGNPRGMARSVGPVSGLATANLRDARVWQADFVDLAAKLTFSEIDRMEGKGTLSDGDIALLRSASSGLEVFGDETRVTEILNKIVLAQREIAEEEKLKLDELRGIVTNPAGIRARRLPDGSFELVED